MKLLNSTKQPTQSFASVLLACTLLGFVHSHHAHSANEPHHMNLSGSFEQFVGQKRHDFGEYLALGESHDLIWMRKLAEIRPPGGDSDSPPQG